MRYQNAQSPDSVSRSNNAWLTMRSRAGELTWVLLGKLALMGSNAALMLLLAQRLELGTYGLLVTVIGAQILLSRLLMLGVDSGMIRLLALPELRHRSNEVVNAGLLVLWCTAGILVLGSLTVGPVLFSLAPVRWPAWALASIVAGAIGMGLVDYGYCYRLSRLEYCAAALLQGGTALSRLGLTAAAALFYPSHPQVVLVAYPVASLLSGLVQTVALTRAGFAWPERALIRRLLRYSLWLGGADMVTVLSLHQGTFLLTLLDQRGSVGLFGLGLTLSLGFIAVSHALFEYLFTRVVRLESIKLMPRFLARALGVALAVVLACVPLIVAAGSLIPWFIPPELRGAVPIFYLLSASMLLLILQCPFNVVCLYLLRPHLLMSVLALRVVLIGALGLSLAPSGGAMGAAAAQFGGTALALATLAVLIALGRPSARRVGATVLTDGNRF